jgi:hypothetical protein
MGVTFDGFERVEGKLNHFFDGLAHDLEAVGEVAKEGIVSTTLAGLGPDDSAYQPYSDSYQKLIDSVGGKPQGTVNLRGIWLAKGDKNPRFRSAERRRLSGAGRGSYVTVTAGGRTFQARTPITRPALGIEDPRSELSVDLISLECDDNKLVIRYNPREQEYMLYHQAGSGKLPQREWFTLKRTAIQAAMRHMLETAFNARVARFNNPS